MNNKIKTLSPQLLPKEIPKVQPLRIHQKVINSRKKRDADQDRDDEIHNCLAHLKPPST
ncbi:hypothetical protein NSPZN2_160043 [Nitrospira defluvii]|uniref:Uncharacterized protein n=1 Tax=Nitrospira defluvii TaxID=330214 RepID=A0ABM8RBI3_9BACT|nr:hypothetical protein NSPZN2_160043 [Nitrospira defluvii]